MRKLSFDIETVWTYLPVLLKGALVTIEISVITLVIATIAGLFLALLRISENKFLRTLAATYVWVFRGIPQLLILFFVYYAFPSLGLKLPAFTAAIIGLSITATAYKCEIFRSGIQAIPKGQIESAIAIGMNYGLIMKRIIIPQAIRIVIPPYINNAILMLKNSSLVAVITVADLMLVSQQIYSATYKPVEILGLAGVLYLAMTSVLMIFQIWAEKKVSYYTN